MARTVDPLARDQVGVQARLPAQRVSAPVDNEALRLAEAISRVEPEARRALQGIADTRAEKARVQAKRDAIEASGAELAEAVRQGRLRPTQNPWYMQAYNREAAAIRAQDRLRNLQTSASSWEESNDAEQFQARWRSEVAGISEEFGEDPDYAVGFAAAEAQITSQVLQQNVQRNTARIEQEREANVGRLAADALVQSYVQNGGLLSPNGAYEALLPAREQWFGTGGSQEGWIAILENAAITAARVTENKSVVRILRAPELLYGPSEQGYRSTATVDDDEPEEDLGILTFDPGASDSGEVQRAFDAALGTEERVPEDPARAPAEDSPVPPPSDKPRTLRVDTPVQENYKFPLPVPGRVSSKYGKRGRGFHSGVDIVVPIGTPVKAQAAGLVVAEGWDDRGGGYFVKVDYGNGVESSYAHLTDKSAKVKKGDIVTPGQVLALSGNTGRSTGPHVHWSVFHNGKRVDPLTWQGKIGGSFEGVQQQAPSALGTAPRTPTVQPGREALEAFPEEGSDRPLTLEEQGLPANLLAAGPSVYSTPGVASRVDQQEFLIGQATEDAAMHRVRVRENERRARGYEGRDLLYEAYDDALSTGGVTDEQMRRFLEDRGYSAPERDYALSLIKETLSDTVTLRRAQVAALAGDRDTAAQIVKFSLEGQRNGYSQDYEDRAVQMVVDGLLTPEEAESAVSASMAETRRQEAEGRSEAAQQRAEAAQARAERREQEALNPGSKVKNIGALEERAVARTALVLNTLSRRGLTRFAQDPEERELLEDRIRRAYLEHLAKNPGDYEGAYKTMEAFSNRLLRNLLAEAREREARNPQKRKAK